MNCSTFLTGRRVVKVSVRFLVGKSEVMTPILGSVAVGPGLCSPQDRLSPAPAPAALCGNSISHAGPRGGWGGRLACSFGSLHGIEVAPVQLTGDLRPGKSRQSPTRRCRAAAWPRGGGYKKELLGKRAATSQNCTFALAEWSVATC